MVGVSPCVGVSGNSEGDEVVLGVLVVAAGLRSGVRNFFHGPKSAGSFQPIKDSGHVTPTATVTLDAVQSFLLGE